MALSQPSPTSIFITTSSSFEAGLPRTALWRCSENKKQTHNNMQIDSKGTSHGQFPLQLVSQVTHMEVYPLLCWMLKQNLPLCSDSRFTVCRSPQTGFISFMERRCDQRKFDYNRSLEEISVLKSNLSQISRNFPFLPARKLKRYRTSLAWCPCAFCVHTTQLGRKWLHRINVLGSMRLDVQNNVLENNTASANASHFLVCLALPSPLPHSISPLK